MKKFLAGLVVLFILMVSVPLQTDAQTCRAARRSSAGKKYNRSSYRAANRRSYNNSYSQGGYANGGDAYQQPSFYRRHRNLINLSAATSGGALIGALVGGKKGALIGTAVGAGSGALYTYVLNKKKRRYYNR